MEWIKIPTDSILYSEFKDSELIALIKYQALYCQLENQPTKEQMKRVLNKKQMKFVQSYSEVVQELCKNQVRVIKQKRNRDKENYKQKQTVRENSDVGKSSDRELVSVADKIRLDYIKEINKEKNQIENQTENQNEKNETEWIGNKIPEKVYIDAGFFFLDNSIPEFKDMTDSECERAYNWIKEKMNMETIARERFISVVRKFKEER